jgi:hypothetical protein
MTQKQSVTLASRLVSLWFFFHAGLNLFAVPGNAYNAFVVAYLGNIRDHTAVEYYRFASLVTPVFYFCVELAIGIFFYRCGPRAIKFLFGAGLLTEDDTIPQG